MAHVTLLSPTGVAGGTVELSEGVFGVQPNVPVMHQVVTAQLARRRAGTQSTKTRAEVSGGGKKPFKQKGTGSARQGSTRAPQWPGGGIALGPKPRKYGQKTPKKMIALALKSALSDRAMQGKIIVVDAWSWTSPSTKAAAKSLVDLGIDGTALVVVQRDDENTIKSFRNLPEVQLIDRKELNAYDVLCNDYIVFTSDTLPTASEPEAKRAVVKAAAKAAGATDAASSKPTTAAKPAVKAAAKPAPKAAAAAKLVEAPVEAAPVIVEAAAQPVAASTSSSDAAQATVTRKVTVRTIVDGVETVEVIEESVEVVDADTIVDHHPDTIDTTVHTTEETIIDGKVVSHTEHFETETAEEIGK
jgi:large subunit ribosomal protein L4